MVRHIPGCAEALPVKLFRLFDPPERFIEHLQRGIELLRLHRLYRLLQIFHCFRCVGGFEIGKNL